MRLRDFTIPAGNGAGWLNEDEQKFGQDLMDQFERLFKDRKVELTPSIMLRTWEITTLAVIARRTLRSLDENGFHQGGENTASGTVEPDSPKQGKNGSRVNPAVDFLMKVFDGARKAVGELEKACEKMGRPIDTHLDTVTSLAPLMKVTGDVLDEAFGTNEEAKNNYIERARQRAHSRT